LVVQHGKRVVRQICPPTQFGSLPPPFPSVSTGDGGWAVGSIRIIHRTVVGFGEAVASGWCTKGSTFLAMIGHPPVQMNYNPALKEKLTGLDIRRTTFLLPLFIFRTEKFLFLLKHLELVKSFRKKRIGGEHLGLQSI
jgi:hypothetical protein